MSYHKKYTLSLSWHTLPLKHLLKRVKNSIDKHTYNDNRQYDGENHLIGIEFFHEQFELTLILQKSRMLQVQDGSRLVGEKDSRIQGIKGSSDCKRFDSASCSASSP
jgi:hypothetical protein